LQQRIRRGELATFEGQIAAHDLVRLYPRVQLAADEFLERIEQLKRAAVPGPRADDTRLPDAPVLIARLRALSDALSQRIAALAVYDTLCDQLRARLVALRDAGALSPAAGQALLDWLDEQLRALAYPPVAEPHRRLFAHDNFLRIMAASVKLVPSGHEFLVEGKESLLAAALRAGLRLDYGCASGHCGACKARVIQGETWKIAEHDYVLSERERYAGYLLACCHTAVTDVVLEAAEARSVADLPYCEIRAQIRKIEPLTATLLQLQVQTPRTQTLRFMAGQQAVLTLEHGAARELPIASCPCDGRHLRFLVWRGDDDFGRALFAQPAPVRQTITVAGPRGTFTLREESPAPALFLALDDGIAPLQSLIEHAVAIDHAVALRLYWLTDPVTWRTQEGWCRALGDALDHFAYAPLDDETALLAAVRADLDQLPMPPQVYLAGPPAGVARLVPALAALGIASDQLVVARTAGSACDEIPDGHG